MKIQILFLGFLLLIFSGCGEKDKTKTPVKTDTENSGGSAALSDASDAQLKDMPDGFYFVALSGARPALYHRRFSETDYRIVWQSKSESVIEVRYSADKKTVFFLTAASYLKEGVFPYHKKLKLYRFDYGAPEKVKLCAEVGDCINYSLFFNTEELIRLETNNFASPEHKVVINTQTIFKLDGVQVESASKRIDITTNGFPQLSGPTQQYVSSDGKYAIALNRDNALVLKELGKRGYTEIIKIVKPLSQVGFTTDNASVVVTVVDVTPGNETLYEKNPETSELILYSIKDEKIKMHLKGSGYKRFLIFGDKVVYENGFGEKSEIVIYNTETQTEEGRISNKGGCGVNNIPQIPDYDA